MYAAKLWKLDDYGIHVGALANLIVLDAKSDVEALRRQPDRRYLIRKGKVLV